MEAMRASAQKLKLAETDVLQLLGETTVDVYLNENAYWKNIPLHVWNYFIGGYQVIKKWLSYRENNVIGRTLSTDECRHVTHMARRLAAVLLLEPLLDTNYQNVKNATYQFVSPTERTDETT